MSEVTRFPRHAPANIIELVIKKATQILKFGIAALQFSERELDIGLDYVQRELIDHIFHSAYHENTRG